MTGQPSFTFRDTEKQPLCTDCEQRMAFTETRQGTFNERDVYTCESCNAVFEDRWTY